ncbi:hypothetical protein V7201_15880 [Bacillus sp. JJ1122]|uniref:hypothetical protein n=1 Tax=Bacillus sp. JJ1122 TaxID=3122951 RepID=UPI002FFDE913
MQIILISTTFVNVAFGVWLYFVLSKCKFLLNDRFGYISVKTSSSTLSLVASLNLFLLFPADFEITGLLNLLLGIGIGWLFGSLLNAQTLIAGIYNGGMGAIMGTMAGAVVMNPAICGLPSTILSEQEIIIFFALLSICIQGITAFMLLFSFRA